MMNLSFWVKDRAFPCKFLKGTYVVNSLGGVSLAFCRFHWFCLFTFSFPVSDCIVANSLELLIVQSLSKDFWSAALVSVFVATNSLY
jgi:hypothetical protein